MYNLIDNLLIILRSEMKMKIRDKIKVNIFLFFLLNISSEICCIYKFI